ncbi:hypothetical protein [Nostoc sp.]|uniref:hypothetical protein n=1 Tax=Nostoc sp. TaxID=1180 RepID=UPI002FFCBB6B
MRSLSPSSAPLRFVKKSVGVRVASRREVRRRHRLQSLHCAIANILGEKYLRQQLMPGKQVAFLSRRYLLSGAIAPCQ